MAQWEDIPPELRNVIYDLVLGQKKNYSNRKRCQRNQTPGILKVSREIRTESLPIWLAGNDFHLRSCLPGLGTGTCWTFNCSSAYSMNSLEVWKPYVNISLVGLTGMANLRWTHHNYKLAVPTVVARESLTTNTCMPQIELYVNGNECRVSIWDSRSWRDLTPEPRVATRQLARVLHAEIRAKEMVKVLETAMGRTLEVIEFKSS